MLHLIKNKDIDRKSMVNCQSIVSRMGFTMLEFLIYTGILAGLIPFIGGIFVYANRGSGQVEARSLVNYNLRLAFERIAQDLKGASSISDPVRGDYSNSLVLRVKSNTVTYDLSGGRLRRALDSGTAEYITSQDVTISNPIFRRFHNTSVPLTTYMLTVDTSITGSYNSANPDYNFSETRTKTVLVEGVYATVRNIYGTHPGPGNTSDGCLTRLPFSKKHRLAKVLEGIFLKNVRASYDILPCPGEFNANNIYPLSP